MNICNQAQDLAVRFFHHGLRERSVVRSVVSLGTLLQISKDLDIAKMPKLTKGTINYDSLSTTVTPP